MSPPPIKLMLLADALDADGEPRYGLLVPPPPSKPGRRAVLMVFNDWAGTMAAKQALEAGR